MVSPPNSLILGTAQITGPHPGRLAVEQLYGYMVRNSKTLGILTTLRGWCFAFRGNQGQLTMTPMFAGNPSQTNVALPGYRQTNVTTMMAIYYMSRISYDTPDTVEILPPGQVGVIEFPFADTDTTQPAPTPRAAPPPAQRHIMPAPHGQHGNYQNYTIRFEPWIRENQLGGKCWIINLDPTQTKAVFKQWEDDDESLKLNETQIYKRLEPLWGQCIPTFLGMDIMEHSNSIIVEYIKVSSSIYFTYVGIAR
jgi:hypothetical protein